MEKEGNLAKGAILSHSTLKELIQDRTLSFEINSQVLSYEVLQKHGLIDETSISLHIGELYRLSGSIYSLDISGRYDLQSYYEKVQPDNQGGIIIEPHELLLGKTLERITTPPNVMGIVEERRTTAGNLGLLIKGVIPPGLRGEQTRFTIYNLERRPVRIFIGKIPPMKVHFYTLSGFEVYRKGRKARVEKYQIYSGGAGRADAIDIGAVELSFWVANGPRTFRSPLMIDFVLVNKSQQILKRIEIYPSLPRDEYAIISCTEPFSLDRPYLQKGARDLAHRIRLERKINPNAKVRGTIKMIFKNPLISPRVIKLEAECYNDKNVEVPIIQITEPQPVFPIEEKGVIGITKEQIITALIATLFVLLIKSLGPYIINLTIEFVRIFLDILG